MKWLKNLFGYSNEEVEENDNYTEEWNDFSSETINSKEEEPVSVQRGFKFPIVSDEEFSKRTIVGTVSVYEDLNFNKLTNNTHNEIDEAIHNQKVQPARERRRRRRFAEETPTSTFNPSPERRLRRHVDEEATSFNNVSERRTRRYFEEEPSTIFNQLTERKLRTRERAEDTSQGLGEQRKIIIRKPRQPEVIANPIPKSPFKLTEVPSPVFGFKDRNIESVNPNTIVEKYGKQDSEMDKLRFRVARRNEQVVGQENKLPTPSIEAIDIVPKKVVNNHFEEDLATIAEQGINYIEKEEEINNSELNDNNDIELVSITEQNILFKETSTYASRELKRTEELEPALETCEQLPEVETEEVQVELEQTQLDEQVVETYIEQSEETNNDVYLSDKKLEELTSVEQQETKPVFEYCDDCDEEVEVFGMEEQEVRVEEIETDTVAEPFEEVVAEMDEQQFQEEQPKAKPVFEYCDDCDDEEVEVFGIEKQENNFNLMNIEEQLNLGKEEIAATVVADTTTEELQQEQVEEMIARPKIRPFNVLMTKYDKIRWEQQLEREKLAAFAKEQLVHTEDIQEEFQEETVMEEDIHFYDEELDQEIDSIEEDLDTDAIEFENDSFVDVEEELEEDIEEVEEEVIEEIVEEPPYYAFPSMDLLDEPVVYEENEQWLNEREEMLNATFASFNIGARVVHRTQGPSVTRFEVQLDPGVKVNKITNLSDDIQLGLAARDIRIEAPIPGKHTVGIEVPNDSGRPVRISEIIDTPEFRNSKSPLTSVLGLDIEGKPIVTDLKKMPHGLIAGATGSGKSVCINSILVSLLYKADPTDVKLILIDPKMVELAPYNNIPHLVSPVITDVKAATAALKWAVEEMERRYQLFAHTGVREIGRYNELVMESKKYNQKLPYIVVVIDELADLMMVAASDVEDAICRIAQKARACGIHLIIATQRPSVDVITGLIKANVPTRIAFSVSSQIDSRTIIDISGAEKLLGRGDMLFLENGSNKAVRLQGTYVTDEEIEAIVTHCKNERQVEYLFQQEDLLKKVEVTEEEDELFLEACEFVVENQAASASMLQRKFKIGYNRAARLIDMMESYGYISENRGSKPRDVLITLTDLEK